MKLNVKFIRIYFLFTLLCLSEINLSKVEMDIKNMLKKVI